MKKVLVDTNVLLNGFEINNDYKYILLSHVNRELEKHKKYGDGELKYKSRKAVRFIEENIEYFEFDIKDYSPTFSNDIDPTYTDNKIVQACIDNEYALMTNDLLLKQHARMHNIELVEEVHLDHQYKGYKEVHLSDQEIADLYQNIDNNTFNLLVNQYLIIYDMYGVCIDKLRWDGNSHVKLKHSPTKKLKAKNVLQELAIDLMMNTDIPIKIIAGNYGSGKTLISVKLALYHVREKGNYAKIMMVRNPQGTGKEIGYLKGTKEDKTADFFKPLIQHLESGEQEAAFLESSGQLSKEIPFYMKGLSIEDSIIVCDEAEDLDTKLIKLIGTRVGGNSAVVFSGDYNQAEDNYKNNNGLIAAIDGLKGDPLVGIVVLEEDVRSSASKVFSRL